MKFTRTYDRKDTGETLTVEIEVDVEDLASQIAARAVFSKTGRASKCGNAVRAKVVDRKPTPGVSQ